jgi:hypothetical protein
MKTLRSDQIDSRIKSLFIMGNETKTKTTPSAYCLRGTGPRITNTTTDHTLIPEPSEQTDRAAKRPFPFSPTMQNGFPGFA